jgi:hypothetical protein
VCLPPPRQDRSLPDRLDALSIVSTRVLGWRAAWWLRERGAGLFAQVLEQHSVGRPDRVYDCAVVAVKPCCDLRVGEVGELAEQSHRDLAGECCRLGSRR